MSIHGLKALALGASLATLLAACGQDTFRVVGPFYNPPAPLAVAAAGTLIRAESTGSLPGASASWRVLYHSRTASGEDIAVSGLVVLPRGTPPPGGFPLIGFGHGTSGIARPCGISQIPKTPQAWAGNQTTYAWISQWVDAGWAVAATDYQGLGAPGFGSYLVGEVEGANVLDSIRAAYQIAGDRLSSHIVLAGHSQGGQSVGFAAQIAPTYAPELNLLGTILIAPIANLSGALECAIEQKPVPPIAAAVVFGMLAVPSFNAAYGLDPKTILTAEGEKTQPIVYETCLLSGGTPFAIATLPIPIIGGATFSTYFQTIDGRLAPSWQNALEANDLGTPAIRIPTLMVQGCGDTTIPISTNLEYFNDAACPAETQIEFQLFPGATHTTIPEIAFEDMNAWAQDRLVGAPAPSNCGAPPVCGGVTPGECAKG